MCAWEEGKRGDWEGRRNLLELGDAFGGRGDGGSGRHHIRAGAICDLWFLVTITGILNSLGPTESGLPGRIYSVSQYAVARREID